MGWLYKQNALRACSLSVILIRSFSRPQWTYGAAYKDDWSNLAYYPAYGLDHIGGIASNVLILIALLILSWAISILLEKRNTTEDLSMFEDGTHELTSYRRAVVKYIAIPCIAAQVLECIINLISCGVSSSPYFSLTPIEAIMFISLEPCFESPLYYTIIKVMPYFSGLVGILCSVIASWAVFGMLVINVRKAETDSDPYFPYFGDSFWSMMTVLNASDWPGPMIPSYNRNHLYFFFFMAFVILVQWGYLNLILGLIISFFEEIWEKNRKNAEQKEKNNKCAEDATGAGEHGGREETAVVHSPLTKGLKDRTEGTLAPVDESNVLNSDGNALSNTVTTNNALTAQDTAASKSSTNIALGVDDDTWRIVKFARALESSRYYQLFADIVFFVIGVTFITAQYPASVLISQLVTKLFEIFMAVLGRKPHISLRGWVKNSRNLANSLLYVTLLFFSLLYFGLCSAGANIPHSASTVTATDDTPNNQNNVMRHTQCRESDLNSTMEPSMDSRIVLCIIVIRTCIIIRLVLLTRNLGWDLFPKAWHREYNRAIAIINETYEPFLYLVLIIMTTMYIFAGIGLQLYGGKISKKPTDPNLEALQDSWCVI